MDIKKSGSRPSTKGPAEYFTGDVRVDPLFEAPNPARGRGASVTFEPGARTAWHTHPLGQTLIVTSGCGLGATRGRANKQLRGRRSRCPPREKHWHGATPTTAMTHIAIQEQLDGKAVDWMEQVSDEQYGGPARRKREVNARNCNGQRRLCLYRYFSRYFLFYTMIAEEGLPRCLQLVTFLQRWF